MILPCDPSKRAGFTLFETMISLGILSLLLAVSLSAVRGPSPGLQLQQRASDLQAEAAAARLRAITDQRTVLFSPDAVTCDGAPAALTFAPDGTATGPDLCLSRDTARLTLRLMPLSGRLALLEPE